jgi:NAD(P)H-flavin reductase
LCDSYNCGQCATQQAQALPACIGGGSNAKLRSDCAADEVRSHENRVQTASEPFRNRGRITDLMDIETDRIMLCGSPGMLEDLRQTFEQRGFAEGSHAELGHFVIEKAYVER